MHKHMNNCHFLLLVAFFCSPDRMVSFTKISCTFPFDLECHVWFNNKWRKQKSIICFSRRTYFVVVWIGVNSFFFSVASRFFPWNNWIDCLWWFIGMVIAREFRACVTIRSVWSLMFLLIIALSIHVFNSNYRYILLLFCVAPVKYSYRVIYKFWFKCSSILLLK